MKCEEVEPLLDAYLDGEMELSRSLEIEKHLAGCRACLKRLEQTKELVTLVKEKARRFDAPGQFHTRMRAALRAEAPPIEPKISWWRPLGFDWILPAAAAAAAVAIVAFVLSVKNSSDSLIQQAMENHIRSLMANHLADVASTDQHTVKPWFAGKLDYSPPVVDPDPSGFPLIGGRLDLLAHRSVAAIVYQRRKHYINLFIWPETEAASSTPPKNLRTRDGYHFLAWAESGMNYLAVSDLDEKELGEFARMIRAQTKLLGK